MENEEKIQFTNISSFRIFSFLGGGGRGGGRGTVGGGGLW